MPLLTGAASGGWRHLREVFKRWQFPSKYLYRDGHGVGTTEPHFTISAAHMLGSPPHKLRKQECLRRLPIAFRLCHTTILT